MIVERCSCKVRFLALVVNTSDLINERSTYTGSLDHSLLAPAAIFTTYIMIGNYVISAVREKQASKFLQAYSLVACSVLQGALSISVFQELKKVGRASTALVLNAILPIFTVMLLTADLVFVLLSNREPMMLPMSPSTQREVSIARTI